MALGEYFIKPNYFDETFDLRSLLNILVMNIFVERKQCNNYIVGWR